MADKSKNSSIKVKPELLLDRASKPFLISAVLCLVLVALIMGKTASVPFYLSDDSNSMQVGFNVLNEIKSGKPFEALNGAPGERRYFPGFYYYQAFRCALLGTHVVGWHLFQMLVYATIGLLTTWVGWRIARSIIPGLIAFVLLMVTGEVAMSSSWMNFVSLPTFEPPLLLLWMSATFFFFKADDAKKLWLKVPAYIVGALLLLWSVMFKETSFLIVGAVLGLTIVLLAARPWERPTSRNLNTLIIFVGLAFCAALWGWNVYNHIPKDQGYGGAGSLHISARGILDGYLAYKEIIVKQSDYVIFFGAALLLIRLIFTRLRQWTLQDWQVILLILAGMAQITSLTIWPYYEGRYTQPAYLCFLLAASIEAFRFYQIQWSKIASLRPTRFHYLATTTLLIVPVLLRLALKPEALEAALRYYLLGMFVVAAVYAWKSYTNRPGLNAFFRVGLLAAPVFTFFIISLQFININAFLMTEYHAREGVRYKATRHAASTVAPRGGIFWLVDADNEGHAWAAKMHVDLFYNRTDTVVGPASYVLSQKPITRGDVLINHTTDTEFSMTGTGTLARLDQEDGGPVFWAKDTKDIRKLVIKAVFYPGQIGNQDIAFGYQGSRLPTYTVTSDTWIPSDEVRARFFK